MHLPCDVLYCNWYELVCAFHVIEVTFIMSTFQCVVFNDLYPQAPVHFLVVPKKPITQLSKTEGDEDKLVSVGPYSPTG